MCKNFKGFSFVKIAPYMSQFPRYVIATFDEGGKYALLFLSWPVNYELQGD